MDLTFTAEEQAFRDEVRSFLKESLPKELAAKGANAQELTKEDVELWHSLLNERGWLAVTWPVEYGGTGWTYCEGRTVARLMRLVCSLRPAPSLGRREFQHQVH